MIKIGEFSKQSCVPIKTLRYYDELDLLKPIQVDPYTGYRYYAAAQLFTINRILALKDLGIPLEQIKKLIQGGLPAGQMVGILRQRQLELEQEVEENQARLERLSVRLKQFEQEDHMSTFDVVIKSIPAVRIVSRRGIVPTYPSQGMLWSELGNAMHRAGIRAVGPCFTLDHDDEYKDSDHDLEVCEQVDDHATLPAPFEVKVLPAEEMMASHIHHGAFNTLTGVYQQMLAWLEQNNYQIIGLGREIYIDTAGDLESRQDNPAYVTEIQFPVKKI
jgi:DNA-binding transcriptional MerR regulator/predicted transcriptional regulator YdeE